MNNIEGNTPPDNVGTNCTSTSIYAFGGLPAATAILVDITGEDAVLDLT